MNAWDVLPAVGVFFLTLDFGVHMSAVRARTVRDSWYSGRWLYPVLLPLGLVSLLEHPIVEPPWVQIFAFLWVPFLAGYCGHAWMVHRRRRMQPRTPESATGGDR